MKASGANAVLFIDLTAIELLAVISTTPGQNFRFDRLRHFGIGSVYACAECMRPGRPKIDLGLYQDNHLAGGTLCCEYAIRAQMTPSPARGVKCGPDVLPASPPLQGWPASEFWQTGRMMLTGFERLLIVSDARNYFVNGAQRRPLLI
jgi:hypothetical protein